MGVESGTRAAHRRTRHAVVAGAAAPGRAERRIDVGGKGVAAALGLDVELIVARGAAQGDAVPVCGVANVVPQISSPHREAAAPAGEREDAAGGGIGDLHVDDRLHGTLDLDRGAVSIATFRYDVLVTVEHDTADKAQPLRRQFLENRGVSVGVAEKLGQPDRAAPHVEHGGELRPLCQRVGRQSVV